MSIDTHNMLLVTWVRNLSSKLIERLSAVRTSSIISLLSEFLSPKYDAFMNIL